MSTDQLLDVDEQLFTIDEPYEDSDDPNRKAHIVNPPGNLHIWQPGMTTKEMVAIARRNGIEVVALCGYRWVPKHDPDKFDACETCIKIAGEIMRGAGE